MPGRCVAPCNKRGSERPHQSAIAWPPPEGTDNSSLCFTLHSFQSRTSPRWSRLCGHRNDPVWRSCDYSRSCARWMRAERNTWTVVVPPMSPTPWSATSKPHAAAASYAAFTAASYGLFGHLVRPLRPSRAVARQWCPPPTHYMCVRMSAPAGTTAASQGRDSSGRRGGWRRGRVGRCQRRW